MSAFTAEVQPQLRAMGLLLGQTLRDYYSDPDNRAEFERWYKAKYGKDYEWKRVQR